MSALPWHDRVASLWAAAEELDPAALRSEMVGLIAEREEGDPEALFEAASVEDFLGQETAAIPLYRAALSAGLSGIRRTEATIQLASSLRNVGDSSGAIALLRGVPEEDPLAPSARAFLALALHDDDKPTPALRRVLADLAPTLPAYGRSVAAYAAELPARPRVRSIAVALIVRDGWVLAERYPENRERGAYLRAPGGGIDFGERAEDAVVRELREELGASVTTRRLLAVVENIFVDGPGTRGHEVAFVFAARSPETDALPLDGRIAVIDGHTEVGWYRLADLQAGELPFYPDGALELACALDTDG